MRRALRVTAGLMLLTTPLAAQRSLTIYNDGRVLMRATLAEPVASGISSHRLALGFLDAASLFSLDPDVMVTGVSYDAAVDERNTLRRALGRKLVFETGGMRNGVRDTVVAEVLGVEPELFRLEDGSVTFQRPGRPRYPADLVLAAPTVSLNVRSTAAKDQLRLAWFTEGASWSAAYQAVLGRGSARVMGQAEVQSARLSVQDAEIQLLAGNVGRAVAKDFALQRARAEMAVAAEAPSTPAGEQQVGEAHLYTIPGRYTITPGVSTVASLFEPGSAPWERVYTIRSQLPWYGPLPQYGEPTQVPVEIQYLFKRPPQSDFGRKPLPAGVWRLYEPDSAGRLQLVGEASTTHSAPGQDLRLTAGNAFDITAERIQVDYTTQRETRRTIGLAGYRVTVNNAKDSAVTVDVLEERHGEWSVLESSVPGEKLSSTLTRFRVRVPARGQAMVSYRLRVVW